MSESQTSLVSSLHVILNSKQLPACMNSLCLAGRTLLLLAIPNTCPGPLPLLQCLQSCFLHHTLVLNCWRLMLPQLAEEELLQIATAEQKVHNVRCTELTYAAVAHQPCMHHEPAMSRVLHLYE